MKKTSISMHTDSELLILNNIQLILDKNPNATQRDLAREINLSLGMTNLILKRFSEKGWMIMKKVSSRHIIYMLSAEGMAELSKRTYRYMKNTVRRAANYKDQFIKYLCAARSCGCTQVLLIGESDVQFIIEYACKKLDLPLTMQDSLDTADCDFHTLVLFADGASHNSTTIPNEVHAADVYDVLAG